MRRRRGGHGRRDDGRRSILRRGARSLVLRRWGRRRAARAQQPRQEFPKAHDGSRRSRGGKARLRPHLPCSERGRPARMERPRRPRSKSGHYRRRGGLRAAGPTSSHEPRAFTKPTGLRRRLGTPLPQPEPGCTAAGPRATASGKNGRETSHPGGTPEHRGLGPTRPQPTTTPMSRGADRRVISTRPAPRTIAARCPPSARSPFAAAPACGGTGRPAA